MRKTFSRLPIRYTSAISVSLGSMPLYAAPSCAYVKGKSMSRDTITGATRGVVHTSSTSVIAIVGTVRMTPAIGAKKRAKPSLSALSDANAAARTKARSHAHSERPNVWPKATQNSADASCFPASANVSAKEGTRYSFPTA